MSWMIYSFTSRRSWFGSIERYMDLESLLAVKNLNLKFIDCIKGNFFEWFMVTEEYSNEMFSAIDAALSEEDLDGDTEGHLIIMREVFRGGNIIMG